MAFTLPPIAVATSPDGAQVARFGHDFPLVAIDAAGGRSPRHAEGCCGTLAQAGVRLAIVPEGTLVDAAVTLYRAGRLQAGGEPSACDHGHDRDHGHDHSAGGGCGRAAAV